MSKLLSTHLGQLAVAATVLVLLAIAALGGRATSSTSAPDPEPSSEPGTSTSAAPQGDSAEPPHPGVSVPDAGSLAGDPVKTARRYIGEWLNRGQGAAQLRRQRPVLVGTSTGPFAQLSAVTIDDALKTGDYGPTNEGTVEFAKQEPSSGDTAAVLLVCRERAQGAPYAITTYIARMSELGPNRYAISALEPQS